MNKLIRALFGGAAKSRKRASAGRRHSRKRRSGGLVDRITAAGDRLAFSWSVRESLYRHISAQVFNGITVEVALDTFRARLQRRKRVSSDKIIAGVARRMRDGSTLAAALGKWVPSDEMSIIASGELSGNLPRSLDLVVSAKRRIARVNSAIKTSIVTPAIYAMAVYGMLWAIGRYVTPGLEMALKKERAQGLVHGLYVAGDFANSWYAALPPVVLAIVIFLAIQSLPRWTGKYRIAAERIFPFSFYRDIQGYNWLMSFTALLQAGKADVEILDRQMMQCTPWMRERLHAIWWRMDNGASLPGALLAKGRNGVPAFGFPNPDIVDEIASLDGFPDFAERISTVAVQWADELETATLRGAKAFGFAMEIAMYVVMGLLMIAINSMSSQLGTVPGM